MNENQEMALSLLDSVVANFFGAGEMTADRAYAMTVLAKAYVEESLGIDHHKRLITMFENPANEMPIMFLNNTSIKKQLRGLKELQSMLSKSPGSGRDTMIFIKDEAERCD